MTLKFTSTPIPDKAAVVMKIGMSGLDSNKEHLHGGIYQRSGNFHTDAPAM
jgi:hypothetical protein